MALLLAGTKLGSRLTELARQSDRIDIAVAWATAWDGLSEVLSVANSQGSGAVRILVGISGYITSPKALRQIGESATLRVYDAGDERLFHPKLYIFHTPQGHICLVGSPNLTWAAFSENVELAVELDDDDGSLVNHFEELWRSDQSLKDLDLAEYAKRWKLAKKKMPKFLRQQTDEPGECDTPSPDVLYGEWTEFLDQLRQAKDLAGAIRTIEEGSTFVRRDWLKNLDDADIGLMLGKKPYAHFGKITRISATNFRGDSSTQVGQRLKIGKALNLVLNQEHFDPALLVEAFTMLVKEVEGCGPALATRLLLFARPDWFVVVNKRSFSWLAKNYGVKVNQSPTGRQYADLITEIQKQKWWKMPRPTAEADSELWQYRAALTDLLAQKNYGAEGSIKNLKHLWLWQSTSSA